MATRSLTVIFLAHVVVYVSFAGKSLYSQANMAIPHGLLWHNNYYTDTDVDMDALAGSLHSLKTTVLNSDQEAFPNPIKNVSFSCLTRIITGLDVEVLDAFGKPHSGILGQNFNWLGNFEECVSVKGYQHSTVDLLLSLPNGNNTLREPFFWGVCMPDTCNEGDIENLILSAFDSLNITLLKLNPAPPVDGPPGPVHTNTKLPYDTGFICVVTACCILGLLMLLGAALDLYIQWFETPENVNGYQKLDGDDQESRTPLLSEATANDSTHVAVQRQTKSNEKKGLLRKFLLCFAVNRSLDKFLNAKQGKDSIGCLNGIRVLSITWVIGAHSALYPLNDLLYYNMKDTVRIVRRLDFAVILQGEYAVDSFFFLSGFLLTYLTLKKMAKTNGKLPWGLFYFHRYLRLTPLYAAVIIFYIFLAPHLGYGPLWYRYTDHPDCRKYWWRNLLYISNFFTNKEMCMTWSWYLPNDMQFFVISPAILILLYKVPKLGAILVSMLTLTSIAIKIGLSARYSAGGILAANTGGESTQYWNAIYDKPYTRISPYLVGMALGFGMARRPHIRMRPVVVFSGWLLATIVGLVVIYVVNNSFYRQWSTAGTAIYSGVSSFAWALSLSWVVLACKNGYGGWINKFLSWNLWLPVGRLTYAVYLVHPIVIRTIYYSTSSSFRGVELTISSKYVSNVVLSHGVALVFALAIEYPFANLEKLIIPSSIEKKYSDQPSSKGKEKPELENAESNTTSLR